MKQNNYVSQYLNVLVTGGLGFVGSHLIDRLVSEGHVVHCLDNLFTGNESWKNSSCNYVNAETSTIFEHFADTKIDLIFHLGEYSRVEQSFDDIDLVFRYNWNCIYEVLRLARKHSAKIIYSGSSTRFGDDGTAAYASPYSYTKMMNADLVKTFCEWFDLSFVITYFYNVYGPRELTDGKYATVIAKFLKARQQSQAVKITRPGTQTRNYTHVDDIVNGLQLASYKGYGDGYGIAAEEAFTVIEIAQMLGLDFDFQPERKGNRLAAPTHTAKIKDLGWQQTHSLPAYLKNL